MSSGKVKCTCGWSWNKSDSSKKDMYICHECGRDNSNNMKNGGWLDNYNDYEVSAPEGFQGDGYSNVGRNSSPAWGGQFEDGGSVYPVNYVPQAQWGLPVGPFTPIAPLALSAANKVKSWFSDDEPVKPIKKPVAKSNTRTLNIVDPRKKMATTNQPLRPNSDLVGGKYSSRHLDKLMQEAKRQGLSKQDMMNLSAMGFQETKWGRSDGNIGHVLGNWKGNDSYQQFISAYKEKMKEEKLFSDFDKHNKNQKGSFSLRKCGIFYKLYNRYVNIGQGNFISVKDQHTLDGLRIELEIASPKLMRLLGVQADKAEIDLKRLEKTIENNKILRNLFVFIFPSNDFKKESRNSGLFFVLNYELIFLKNSYIFLRG